MGRIRSVRPEFFTSLDVAALSIPARLAWIGLWTVADDKGRGIDDSRLVKSALYPLDDAVTASVVEEYLVELEARGRLVRYAVSGRHYFEIPNFTTYQKPNRPTDSKIPPPVSLTADAVRPHNDFTNGSLPEGRGIVEEKEGSEHPPSRFCSKHQPSGSGGKPCGACGDARKLYEAAVLAKPAPSTYVPPTRSESLRNMCPEPGHDAYPREPACELCLRIAAAEGSAAA